MIHDVHHHRNIIVIFTHYLQRGVRSFNDLSFLEETGSGSGGVDIGYPLPLSMDDYWALDRDRLLDQLVIRALANPEEWTELRKTFGEFKFIIKLFFRI